MSQKYKYPRTFHCPWSLGKTDDDKTLSNMDHFKDKEVVVTIKMDGENLTGYNGGFTHARSVDSKNHESRNWVKKLFANIGFNIPEGWRICGENLFATHSIKYEYLNTFFYVFSIWNENNEALSWDDTVEWTSMIFEHDNPQEMMVPVIYRGVYDEDAIKESFENYSNESIDEVEGYVIRLASSFKYEDFKTSVAKFVRANHVQTDQHWSKNWDYNHTKDENLNNKG